MQESTREKLKNKLVELTCKLRVTGDERKQIVAGYVSVMKKQKKKIDAISIAISSNDEQVLSEYFGDEYADLLGIK